MVFFKRLVDDKPIKTELLGVYKYKSIEEPKEYDEVTTAIYLHTYSATTLKIEIASTPISVFSAFDDGSSKTTKVLYDLQSYPTEETGGVFKFKLANLKIKMYNVFLIHTKRYSILMLPTREKITYSKKKDLNLP